MLFSSNWRRSDQLENQHFCELSTTWWEHWHLQLLRVSSTVNLRYIIGYNAKLGTHCCYHPQFLWWTPKSVWKLWNNSLVWYSLGQYHNSKRGRIDSTIYMLKKKDSNCTCHNNHDSCWQLVMKKIVAEFAEWHEQNTLLCYCLSFDWCFFPCHIMYIC